MARGFPATPSAVPVLAVRGIYGGGAEDSELGVTGADRPGTQHLEEDRVLLCRSECGLDVGLRGRAEALERRLMTIGRLRPEERDAERPLKITRCRQDLAVNRAKVLGPELAGAQAREPVEKLRLSRRRVHRSPVARLDLTDLRRHARAATEELDDLLVERVHLAPELLEGVAAVSIFRHATNLADRPAHSAIRRA